MRRGYGYMLLVVIIVALLSAAAVWMRGAWRDMTCAMNVENIATSMTMYASDWGCFPDPDRWVDQLGLGYLQNLKVLKCPADNTGARCSYGMNRALAGVRSQGIHNSPDDVVSVYETAHPGDNPSGGPEDVASPPRHPWSHEFRCYEGNMYGYVSGKIVPGEEYKLPHLTTFDPGSPQHPNPSLAPTPRAGR